MVVKRVVSNREKIEKENDPDEKKIQKRIRELAIESLKATGDLPIDYKPT